MRLPADEHGSCSNRTNDRWPRHLDEATWRFASLIALCRLAGNELDPEARANVGLAPILSETQHGSNFPPQRHFTRTRGGLHSANLGLSHSRCPEPRSGDIADWGTPERRLPKLLPNLATKAR